MIHTVLSQQPGCVVDPSYVMYWSVLGNKDLKARCLIWVEEPDGGEKNANECIIKICIK